MTCPHCAHFDEVTFPELKKRYIDTGKVRYILREFPLDTLAAAAFMLARCAGKDDPAKYFALVDTLFRQQQHWAVQKPIPPLMAIAKQAGFTEQTFNACLADQKMLDGIEKVRQRAIDSFKVHSTPTFFINGTVHEAPSASTTWPSSSTPTSRAEPRRPPGAAKIARDMHYGDTAGKSFSARAGLAAARARARHLAIRAAACLDSPT